MATAVTEDLVVPEGSVRTYVQNTDNGIGAALLMGGSGSSMYEPSLINRGEMHLSSSDGLNGTLLHYSSHLFWDDALIENYGLISAVNDRHASAIFAPTWCPDLYNSGTIKASASESADGIQTWDNTSRFTNAGTGRILAESAGTAIAVRMANGHGIITGDGAIYGGGSFTNHGQVIARSTGVTRPNQWAGAVALHLGTGGPGDYISIVNTGLIEATDADPAPGHSTGIFLNGDVGGKIVNSGTIRGDNAIEEQSNDQAGTYNLTVENSGLLEGRVKLSEGNDLLANSGTIVGNVDLGQNADTLVNRGTITGEVALGAGNDVYDGSGGVQNGRVLGQDGADSLIGTAGNDTLDGGDGDDKIDGGDGSDELTGGLGNDTLIGRGGFGNVDVAVFAGNYADYRIVTGSTTTITGLGSRAGEGTDSLLGIEQVRFADITVSLGINPNNPPVRGQPEMVDQAVDGGSNYSYQIPETAFIELDGTPLTFTAHLADGSTLPSWLSFDGSTRTFTGVPPVWVGGTTYDIVVTAADQYSDPAEDFGDYQISDDFLLTINLVGGPDIVGTDGDDILHGTFGRETLIGLAGNDTLEGNQGADTLDGGTGDDTLIGGFGNDYYLIDIGADRALEGVGEGYDAAFTTVSFTLEAGSEIEELRVTDAAGLAAINLTGNDFNQVLAGNAGVNVLNGGGGGDYLEGRGGVDTLDGGTGNDVMRGGTGDDYFLIDSSADRALEAGGEGYDTAFTAVSFALEAESEVDALRVTDAAGVASLSLTGNAFNQVLAGNAGANVLNGGGGDDYLEGRGGSDTLDGGTGNDVLRGGTGDDFYRIDGALDRALEAVGEGFDTAFTMVSFTLETGSEIDALRLSDSASVAALNLTGNELNQILSGNAGANVLNGGGGDDYIQAGAGIDTLDGGSGSDVLIGGTGNDYYVIDATTDRVIEDSAAGYDVAFTTATFGLASGSSVEELRIANSGGTEARNLWGNEFGQLLAGNDGENFLSGGGGNDTIWALGGSDRLEGGAGDDILIGGAGQDVFGFSETGYTDRVVDFVSGTDRIDLRSIDAVPGTAGDDAFTWIGGNDFTDVAGQLRSYSSGGVNYLAGDVDGNGTADFLIDLGSTQVGASDILL